MKTSKPTTIILSGFALIITLVITSLAISLYQLNLSQNVLYEGVTLETRHTALTTALQDIATKRSSLIMKILHTDDPFTKDELIQQFYALGENFMGKRSELNQLQLDIYEQHILSEHTKHSQIIVPAQHQVLALSIEGTYEEAHNLFISKAYPLQQENNDLLYKLSDYQDNEIIQRVALLADQLKNTFLIIFIAGTLVIVFCIFVAIFIYKRLTHNISTLQNTKDQLSKSITDLKNMKNALDQHAIVSITDTAGYITYVNEKFCTVSQYSSEELLGHSHNIINSGLHNKELFGDMWTTITSGTTWHGEIRNRKKDGSYYWVESTIVPFLDKNNLPYQYIAIRTDITHIKQTEEDLELSLEQLAIESVKAQESNTLKDSIISTMTHELRTPLNSILGFTQLLQFDNEHFTSMQNDNIQCIDEAGKELLGKVDVIMLYSKLKSRSLTLKYTESDLDTIFTSIISKAKADHTDAHVLPTLTNTSNITIHADTPLLHKAFTYIIENAIKFTKQGHINITCSELASGSPLPDTPFVTRFDSALILIEDTGIGISDENIQIVFDEFRQVDENDDRRFEGTGIGLTLAKSIINQHQGQIWLTSTLNKGTKVYINMPKFKPTTNT